MYRICKYDLGNLILLQNKSDNNINNNNNNNNNNSSNSNNIGFYSETYLEPT